LLLVLAVVLGLVLGLWVPAMVIERYRSVTINK
jgi:hypothetical protein